MTRNNQVGELGAHNVMLAYTQGAQFGDYSVPSYNTIWNKIMGLASCAWK